MEGMNLLITLLTTHAKTRNAKGKFFIGDCNMTYLIPRLTVSQLWLVARCHNIFVGTKWTIKQARNALLKHECQHCSKYCHYLVMLESVTKKETTKPYQENIGKNKMILYMP